MEKCLAGQKALVTGGSSGIGRGIALALGKAGADVVVNIHSGAERANKVAAEIQRAGGRAYSHGADVTSEKQVQALFRRMIEEFGTIDILVNNAGVRKDAPFERMSLADWNLVLNINLTGQFLCAREAVREFKRRGVVKKISRAAGKIICISSVHRVIPWARHANYAASKGGVMLMMKSLAQEVARDGIRVSSIAPGAIRTPINEVAWRTPKAYSDLMKPIPSQRIGEPDEIGRVAVWLASDDADYVHGATIFVDGGMTLYPGFEVGG